MGDEEEQAKRTITIRAGEIQRSGTPICDDHGNQIHHTIIFQSLEPVTEAITMVTVALNRIAEPDATVGEQVETINDIMANYVGPILTSRDDRRRFENLILGTTITGDDGRRVRVQVPLDRAILATIAGDSHPNGIETVITAKGGHRPPSAHATTARRRGRRR